ncbi:hypothetical protein psal_cds_1429 [Pandoravirus salinus]|uniref:Uncharacterized protein n=1 Tax=Pandoravirus salinus TaxID=1349410 RepID=S4W636_9VIRU|nr:hypothetical protein psal_cds_1429 [Pandoravirus salinus]AGO85875.2 hypothetical protein psal_cds_1429 [Pandoravirus salinus]
MDQWSFCLRGRRRVPGTDKQKSSRRSKIAALPPVVVGIGRPPQKSREPVNRREAAFRKKIGDLFLAAFSLFFSGAERVGAPCSSGRPVVLSRHKGKSYGKYQRKNVDDKAQWRARRSARPKKKKKT